MKLKHGIKVGLVTFGILGSLSSSFYVGYSQNYRIKNLQKETEKLQKELKTTKKQNKEYLNEMEDLTNQVNEINTLISEKTNWRIPTIKLGLCSSSKTWFKSYEPYQAITDKTSVQYQLIHSDQIYVGNDGLLYSNDGYIGVALGNVYGKVGDKFIIRFDNGNETKVIKLDEKATKDTVNDCYHKTDGSMIEVLVDKDLAAQSYPLAIKVWGDFNYSDKFNGAVEEIYKVIE